MKQPSKFRSATQYPLEVFISVLRETATEPVSGDTPEAIAKYWRSAVEATPDFRPDKEQCYAIYLNTRRRIVAHELVSVGVLDQVPVHPREVYRTAVVLNAAAVIILHNHPSGETTPSESDIRVTRELIRAGMTLKIELLDHVIVAAAPTVLPGHRGWTSLRELGYFHS